MKAKLEEFASVFFSALGIAFVALGILVVPADAFAAYNGECVNCKNSPTRPQCASDCCSTFKDDLTARCQCCNDACGDDAACLKRCTEEACGNDPECQANRAFGGPCVAASICDTGCAFLPIATCPERKILCNAIPLPPNSPTGCTGCVCSENPVTKACNCVP